MKEIILADESIKLRDAFDKDAKEYLKIPFNKELLKMYGSSMSPSTEKKLDKAKLLVSEINSTPYEWAIEYEGKFIGQVRLTIDNENNKAKFAIGIFNPQYWNKGIGTKVSNTILNFGFYELELHRIYLKVLAYNKRAIKSYENVGFKIEGEEREGAFINGKYETDIHMSILKSEYEQSNV
ncbi:GNAT family protein [Staphylococcus saprophyticus]|uniref:GNAT family N-acetyltransferase n=1 Tax=Staphylococcus saprophyticus TaxID=29385 RepID=UPI00085356E5|nr:GNAT family protein [Staphylococcus saprophyticus]MDW4280211.1 GNAT family protein [Staphylococcus saprophyticus]MDW4294913.1 GNAT family protein [Staphylococcus saprophyticus]MDW4326660.1 GNAT family protein [Staphylococcus saprophyticus]MDW4346604.1 GNAT family protein [Staphylococcus saprophyticus]MDW4370994.1 GNAT family protein [Staphylococcus saprophyticus]